MHMLSWLHKKHIACGSLLVLGIDAVRPAFHLVGGQHTHVFTELSPKGAVYWRWLPGCLANGPGPCSSPVPGLLHVALLSLCRCPSAWVPIGFLSVCFVQVYLILFPCVRTQTLTVTSSPLKDTESKLLVGGEDEPKWLILGHRL